MGDELARRLERENRRWKCVAGIAALGLTLSLLFGGPLGSRAVVEVGYIHQKEKFLRDMAAEGWELVQVVPTEWRTPGQGQAGVFERGVMVARRPTVPGK